MGTTIADFRLLGLLGSGGIGHVYIASPTLAAASDRRFALKLLRPELAHRPDIIHRFEREAMAAARVRHENVLEVHRPVTVLQNARFFTMEVLVGLDLADTLAYTGRLTVDRAVRIVRGVARGLSAAHAAGVVHRDVKPENVFLVHEPDGSEVVKVLDFGAAWIVGETSPGGRRITSRAAVVGTPEYMAPEQLDGAEGHPCADVYALGVVLFELLVGKVPFSGSTWQELAHVKSTSSLPNVPHVSSALAALVRRALAPSPSDRFGSADELLRAIEASTEAR